MRDKPNGTKYRHSKNCLIREHTVIAEAVLGKKLPAGAAVHHVDGDKGNNCKNNLVICQDRAYHALLHVRAKALAACGDVNKRFCSVCKEWLDQDCFYFRYDRKEPRRIHACKKCSSNICNKYYDEFGRDNRRRRNQSKARNVS